MKNTNQTAGKTATESIGVTEMQKDNSFVLRDEGNKYKSQIWGEKHENGDISLFGFDEPFDKVSKMIYLKKEELEALTKILKEAEN